MPDDLLDVSTHFAFGRNWLDFAEKIGPDKILRATEDMVTLLGSDTLKGKSFLDIGCGSGLHALAALGLGATSVTAIDVDRDSVEATKKTLTEFAPQRAQWSVSEMSVFDSATLGQFDIVYSWGVLHHTGDVYRAIRCAAERVKPGGTLCIAIYRKTLLCGFWTAEKRLYSRSPEWGQWIIRGFWRAWLAALRGLSIARRPVKFMRQSGQFYTTDLPRGMDEDNDIHDWLGGYPYESMQPGEVADLLTSLGFEEIRAFTQSLRTTIGLRGSGCDEYVYRKIA